MLTRSSAAVALAGLVVALGAATPAVAADYPAPGKPGAVQKKPKGPFHTLKVCKKGCKFKTIQSAFNKAKAGDTVRVANGTYKESVKVTGPSKRYIKLIGNASDPSKVVLDLRSLKAPKNQQAVLINNANEVTLQGFTAIGYKGNGFFVTNATGYTFANLHAMLGGVYGIYAFNTIGGTMRDSVAAWNNDGGFYIGQTPPQDKPVRTIVTNIESYGNVLGWSGTNMRYVTITKSRFYNNGTGLAPNALTSEKYPPEEDNVITDNDIFWNNFNYYNGAPFEVRPPTAESTPYPVGVGLILFGGRRNVVENNRIHGNFLAGVAAVQQLLLEDPSAKDLIGNQVKNNTFGDGGADLNGRDLVYDGNGQDNCFGPNTGVTTTFPQDGSTLVNCPFTGNNNFESSVQAAMVNWAVGDATHQANWIVHPHAPIAGLTPLEQYATYTGTKPS
jgi:hypothetical protein